MGVESLAVMKRIPLDPWLEALEKALKTVRQADSAEGAHDFRVAIARLRVWLTLGGWHLLDDDLKRLRDSAARLRNLDAQLQEQRPPEALAQRWRGERERERQIFLRSLERAPTGAIFEVLRELPAVRRKDAKKTVARLAQKALHDGPRAVTVKQLHRLRRDLRKLRYAQEWLERDAGTLSKAQDAAGAVVDATIALQLSRGDEAPAFRSRKRNELDLAREDARKKWRGVRGEIQGLAR